jgi:hypothetical protein
MSTWSYRIVKYCNGAGYGLHEVYYDDEGEAWGMTEDPIGFACDEDESPLGVYNALVKAKTDAQFYGVFEEPEEGKWPGKAPG